MTLTIVSYFVLILIIVILGVIMVKQKVQMKKMDRQLDNLDNWKAACEKERLNNKCLKARLKVCEWALRELVDWKEIALGRIQERLNTVYPDLAQINLEVESWSHAYQVLKDMVYQHTEETEA